MRWWRWVFGWACLAFVFAFAFALPARAGDDFAAIHVCVRPDIVPPTTAAWVFTGGSASFVVTIDRKDFKKQAGDLAIYVFDPYAPPDSVKLFPKKYANLVCPPPPGKPVAPPVDPKKDAAAKADNKPVATGGGTIAVDPKDKDKDKKKDKADEPPPGTPPPIVYPRNGAPPPPSEWHPSPPKGGVTENWPHTVLPIRKAPPSLLPNVADGHGVLPLAGPNGRGWMLPMANHLPSSDPKPATTEASGDGTKKGDGAPKTAYEQWCEQIGLAGGLANLQLGEDIHAADGSKYGIPGGKNPNGIKSPTAQAAAGSLMVVAAVITAGGFDKKLYDAVKKGVPIIIRGGGKAAEQAAEKLIADAVATKGVLGPAFLADGLNKSGAIGEYSVMAKFTQGLGGRWQAHHILEVKFATRYFSVATDRLPAVILTEAEHKAITAKLASKTATVENSKELWAVYQEVYGKHPSWLAAIESYFKK